MERVVLVALFGGVLMMGAGCGFWSAVWDSCCVARVWFRWVRCRASNDFGSEPPPSWVEFREECLAAVEEDRVLEQRARLGGGP